MSEENEDYYEILLFSFKKEIRDSIAPKTSVRKVAFENTDPFEIG